MLTILFTSKNQRLGDLLAGTIVLRERTGAGRSVPATFMVPPGYEAYASTLDVSGLSAADYGAVRAFLLRANSLQPAQRYDLARQIATPLLGRLRHTPPPWVSPEALLMCVAALYQDRQRRLDPVAPVGWEGQTGWLPPATPPAARAWPPPAAPVPVPVSAESPAPAPAPVSAAPRPRPRRNRTGSSPRRDRYLDRIGAMSSTRFRKTRPGRRGLVVSTKVENDAHTAPRLSVKVSNPPGES